MDTPIEQMSLEELKARLELMDRAQCIEEKVARELLAISKELVRRIDADGSSKKLLADAAGPGI